MPVDEKILALRDGTCVPVRQIRPEDAPALGRMVQRLSERTKYLRYFGPVRELSTAKLRHFAVVDGTDRFALVALDPADAREIIAVVRYDREKDTDAAEYAAVVEDRFQGRGVGIGMTRRLIEAARERGIRSLYAFVMHENKQMLSLLRSLDLPEEIHWEGDVERVEIDLSYA